MAESAINDDAVEAAVSAYDEARCRAHGPHERPMSDRNRQTISPMIRAALEAAAPLIRAQALEEAAKRIGSGHWACCDPAAYDGGECCGEFVDARDAIRALKEPRVAANGEGE